VCVCVRVRGLPALRGGKGVLAASRLLTQQQQQQQHTCGAPSMTRSPIHSTPSQSSTTQSTPSSSVGRAAAAAAAAAAATTAAAPPAARRALCLVPQNAPMRAERRPNLVTRELEGQRVEMCIALECTRELSFATFVQLNGRKPVTCGILQTLPL
jgi:hypothetical protein